MQKNWYNKELKEKLQLFHDLYKKCNEEEKQVLSESIETILSVLTKYRRERQEINELILEEYYALIDYKNLWSIPEEMAKFFQDEDTYNFEFYLPISNNDVIDLTHEFFKKGTNKQFYELFLQLLKQRKNIHFIKTNDLFYADILFLAYDKSIYLQMKRRNEFLDIPALAHEFGHGIQFLMNYNKSIYGELNPYSEIISTFFELICNEYFKNTKEFKYHAIFTRLEEWLMRCETALNLKRELRIIRELQIEEHENKNDLNRKVDDLVNSTNEYLLNYIMGNNNSSNFVYIVGESIAIELFMIYLKDPEYALYLLTKLINIDLRLSKEEYLDKIMDLGIMPCDNLSSYDEHVKRGLIR